MSTESETGWSKEWPHKAGAGDEYYFVRRVDGRDVVVMAFSMGKAWLNGIPHEPSEMRHHLFLGPLSPADTEQLGRLREAALVVLQMEHRPSGLRKRLAFAALRNALGTSGLPVSTASSD